MIFSLPDYAIAYDGIVHSTVPLDYYIIIQSIILN